MNRQDEPADRKAAEGRPVTGPGLLLRSLLVPYCSDSTLGGNLASLGGALARIRHSSAADTILGYTFTMMVRRRLALQPDLRAATRYVGEAMGRVEGEPVDGEQLRRGEAVVRAALGEPWLVDDIAPLERGPVMLALLGDLVQTGGVPRRQLDELLVAAEVHERLFGGPGEAGARSRRRGRKGRATDSPPAVDQPSTTSGRPRSIAARWLRAYIIAATRGSAQRPRGDASDVAVYDAAFEIATRRRFRTGQSLRDIALCALNAHQRFPDGNPGVQAIELVIREKLGESVPVGGLEHSTWLLARLFAMVVMVNDLGLLPSELDNFLIDAEDLAVERGFTPQLAG